MYVAARMSAFALRPTGRASGSVDTPITEVVALLKEAQSRAALAAVAAGSSAAGGTAAVDNDAVLAPIRDAMHILSSTELYEPTLAATGRLHHDRVANDLFDGLVTQSHMQLSSIGKDRKKSLSEAMRTMKRQSLVNPSLPRSSELHADIEAHMQRVHTWQFDILQLERLTAHRPLVVVGMRVFSKWKVVEFLRCDESCMQRWLQAIEASYHSANPYHNATHAADVLQAVAHYLSSETVANDLEHMHAIAALLAAVVHDVDHPAVTNAYLINSRHALALLYNDISVLENHHLALTFKMMNKEPRINIMANVAPRDYTTLRQAIVEMVLATDMRRHFEHLAKFQQRMLECKNPAPPCNADGSLLEELEEYEDMGRPSAMGDNEERDRRSISTSRSSCVSVNCLQLVPPSTAMNGSSTASAADDAVALAERMDRSMTLCRMIVKCGDVCNPARPWRLCREWALRICEEYFRQTADERARKLPLSMESFDRETCNVPRTQCGFTDMFARQMFTSWVEYSGQNHLLAQLEENYSRWKEEADVWTTNWNYNFGAPRKSV